MMDFKMPGIVIGLPPAETALLAELVDIFNKHQAANRKKDKYYEGHVTLNDVNLGIALPEGLSGLEIGCAWGAKCVDVLAGRSMFDGFVGENGEDADELNGIVAGNRLIGAYKRAVRDELKLGASFATLSRDAAVGCKIRFHSEETAAAKWNGDLDRIGAGMAIISAKKDEFDQKSRPTLVYLYTDTAIWALRREGELWSARYYPHRMGRPLMEPMIYDATNKKPFGRSRLKAPVRHLIEGYIRTVANASIGLEFATSPQKYLLGVTDEQYETLINEKFKQYVGSILAATANPETLQNPVFGQLAQGGIEPHVQMMRILSTQFSAATGLSVTDTGVVNDANPTSSDAILAQTKTLVGMAEELNADNGEALRTIAQMALAIKNETTIDGLTDEQRDVVAHFKNPAMPSVSVTADAAVKIAGARPTFAQTDTFLEMLGFSQADVRRIKAQEQRARGLAVLEELEAE